MLKLGLTLVLGALVLGEGCTKREPASHAPQASPPVSSPTVNVPPRLDASLAQIPAPPSPLKPLAEGKRVRITKLWVAPVEITVPSDFKLKMEGGVELPPTAYLEGPDLKVSVNVPAAGFISLESEKKHFIESYPDTTYIRAYETEEGFLAVNQLTFAGQVRYTAHVVSPKLKLECSAGDLDTLKQAELAASICLTLRPTFGKAARR